MNIRPWLEVLPVPALGPTMVEKSVCTLGSRRTISATAVWCCTMASNEVPCAASVTAKTALWSSSGMKPLGMCMNR